MSVVPLPLPESICHYLIAGVIRTTPMLIVQLQPGPQRILLGNAAAFGLTAEAGELAELLIGSDPGFNGVLLETLQIGSGRPCAVHQVAEAGLRYVLLFDRTEIHAQLQRSQQMANETELARRALQLRWDRLHQAHQALNEEVEAAHARQGLQRQMVHQLAHEFGTPISAVLGQIQSLIGAANLDASALHGLHNARRGVEHLHQLVESVLDQARLQSHQFELCPVRCDLASLFDDFRALFHSVATERGLQWQVSLEPAIPPSVQVDSLRLRQIIYNLLNNAFKFTRQGQVAMTAVWARDRLTVSVSDTGRGMNPAQLARLFEPFSRHDLSVPGTGLGLSISQNVLLHMDSSLVVDSEPGAGSRFSFEIGAPAAELEDAEDGSGLRALIIDDDADMIELIQQMLLRHHWTVASATAWAEAMAQQGEAPNVILIDLSLGIESGLDAIAKARVQWPSAAIVAMSADRSLHQQSRSRELGAMAFLGKPFAEADLLACLPHSSAPNGVADPQRRAATH